MKWGVVWATLMLVFVAPLSALAQVQPVLGFDSKNFSFGVVSEKTVVAHDFIITNSGNAPLLLSKIVTGCGCISAPTAPVSIEAGTTLPLKISFNTNGFAGEQSRDIQLVTNDPQQPLVVLTLSGTVASAMEVSPAAIQFGEVVVGHQATRPFSISFRGAEPAVTTTSKLLRISKVSSTTSTAHYEVQLRSLQREESEESTLGVSIGDFRERILIDSPSFGSKSLPVVAKVVSNWVVSPPKLEFGVISEKNSARTITLSERARSAFGSSSRGSSNEKLSVRVTGSNAVTGRIGKRPDSGEYLVVVDVDPALMAGDLQSSVVVSGEEGIVAEIPVHAVLPAHLD